MGKATRFKIVHVCCSVYLIGTIFIINYPTHAINFENNFDMADGKRSYEAALSDSKIPKYGTCWKNALTKLNTYCKKLSDDKQHRLALYFTNCFLKKIGTSDYVYCEDSEDISSCTSQMKDSDRNIYSTFFTHTHNMCGFLQMTVWHEITEKTITNLAQSSETVAEQLATSAQVQDEIISKQREALDNQKEIITSGSKLNKAIGESSNNIQQMFQDYKKTTQEQRMMISEVFDRVSSLQSLVLGEFTGFYSMIFYAISVLICYLLTSTPRTSGARFWMFVIMTVDVFMERLLVSYFTGPKSTTNDLSEELYTKLWLCRKAFWLFALSILIRAVYTYKDLNELNNKLLVEIQKQNMELKTFVLTKTYASSHTHVDGPLKIKPPAQIGQGDSVLPDIYKQVRYPDDSSSESDSDCDPSFRLFSVSDDEFDDSVSICSSYVSDCSSYTFTRESTPCLLDELNDIRQATPLRELEKDMKQRKTKRKSADSCDVSHTYNLRRRSSDAAFKPNPVIFSESPDHFAKTVRSLARQAMRNRFEIESDYFTIEQSNNFSPGPGPSSSGQ